MKFSKTDPTPAYPVLRMISEQGFWELGIRQMLYGYRVSAGKVGTLSYEIDYCCGASPTWITQVLAAVIAAFAPLPETLRTSEIQDIFPVQHVKPMVNDLECWDRLLKLAEEGVAHVH